MKATRWQWATVLAAAVVLTAACGPAWAQGRGVRGGRGGVGPGAGRIRPGDAGPMFTGEWLEMVTVLKLDVVQQARLLKVIDEVGKARQELDKASVEAERFAMDSNSEANRKKGQEALQKIKALREQVAVNAKARAFDICTAEQKVVWTAYKLEKHFKAELADLEPKLSDDQGFRLKALCEDAGKRSPCPDAPANKPLLESVRKDIVAKVLSEDQKKNYADIVAGKAGA